MKPNRVLTAMLCITLIGITFSCGKDDGNATNTGSNDNGQAQNTDIHLTMRHSWRWWFRYPGATEINSDTLVWQGNLLKAIIGTGKAELYYEGDVLKTFVNYDSDGRASEKHLIYDALGRPTGYYSTSNPDNIKTLTYNEQGEIILIENGYDIRNLVWENGNVVSDGFNTFTYDDKPSAFKGMEMYGLMTENYYMMSTNNVISVNSYTYDNSYTGGRLSQRTRSDSLGIILYECFSYSDGTGETNLPVSHLTVLYDPAEAQDSRVPGWSGIYLNGTDVPIRLVTNGPFRFIGWSDGDTNYSRTITVTQDTTITALFERTH